MSATHEDQPETLERVPPDQWEIPLVGATEEEVVAKPERTMPSPTQIPSDQKEQELKKRLEVMGALWEKAFNPMTTPDSPPEVTPEQVLEVVAPEEYPRIEHTIQRKIAEHYDDVAEEQETNRLLKQNIQPSTQFHNWIKSILIQTVASNSPYKENSRNEDGKLSVLDLACGKGGDVLKWARQNTEHYVGVDISDRSIIEARERLAREAAKGRYTVPLSTNYHFLTYDLTDATLDKVIEEQTGLTQFGAVSIQFALHYFFQNETDIRMLLYSVSRLLKDDGYFLGTVVDDCSVIQKVIENENKVHKGDFQHKIGNTIYSINYPHELVTKIENGDSFNMSYTFALLPSVSYLEEYIVRQDVFLDLCAEYELEPVYFANFQEFYFTHKNIPEYQHIMSQIVKVYGKRFLETFPTSIRTKPSWELASIYKVFLLKRKPRLVVPIPVADSSAADSVVSEDFSQGGGAMSVAGGINGAEQTQSDAVVNPHQLTRIIENLEHYRNLGLIEFENDSCVIIKDIEPKSKKHYLVLPKSYREIDTLTDADIPLLEYMKDFAHQNVFEPYNLIGCHAVPTQKLLSLHVLSDDLEGTHCTKKGHIKCFTTPFFMRVDLILRLLRKYKKLDIDKNQYMEYLGPKEDREELIKKPLPTSQVVLQDDMLTPLDDVLLRTVASSEGEGEDSGVGEDQVVTEDSEVLDDGDIVEEMTSKKRKKGDEWETLQTHETPEDSADVAEQAKDSSDDVGFFKSESTIDDDDDTDIDSDFERSILKKIEQSQSQPLQSQPLQSQPLQSQPLQSQPQQSKSQELPPSQSHQQTPPSPQSKPIVDGQKDEEPGTTYGILKQISLDGVRGADKL